jgi:putative aldouronate transport system permease protein
MDIGLLYPATDVIDTYVYRGLRNGQYAMTTAVGFFQSLVGLACILGANGIVRKIDPERALF